MTQIDWKYPERDGWPPEEEKAYREYLVTATDLNYEWVSIYRWWYDAFWDVRDVDEILPNKNVIAWAEVEPAKPLVD